MSVTFCIPHYNNSNLALRCIKSITSEGFDGRIVVVDDCSEQIEVERLSRGLASVTGAASIELIVNTKNRGVTFTKNRAYFAAFSDWCVFLDCDDYLMPNGLVPLLLELSTVNADVVLFHCDNLPSVGNEGTYIDLRRFINHGTGSEAMAAVRKSTWCGKVYVGALRGYEGIGLIRGLASGKTMFLSRLTPRYYSDESKNRLSVGSGFWSRSHLLAQGHCLLAQRYKIFLTFPRFVRLLASSGAYKLVAFFYK